MNKLNQTILCFFACFINFECMAEVFFNNYPFSPDGKYIICTKQNKKTSDIYQIDVETLSDFKKIVTSKKGEQYIAPSYSPDGKKIVFSIVSKDNSANLYIMNIDGTNIEPLLTTKHNDVNPIFSSDGKVIYFRRAKYFGNYSPIAQPHWHKLDIVSINIDGSNEQAVTEKDYFGLGLVGFFCDNFLLIQAEDENKSIYSLWTIDINRKMEMNFIKPNLDQFKPDLKLKPWAIKPMEYNRFGYPSLSFDKNYLIFTWAGKYQGYFGHEIYKMNIETKETTKITDLRTYIANPFMLPNGKFIFKADFKYKSDGEAKYKLYVVDGDGKNLKEIKLPK